MYSHILVRFGELSTKGKNKMQFVRQLARNITKLAGGKPHVLIDRIILPYEQNVFQKLNYVFGIQSYSPIVIIPAKVALIKTKLSQMLATLNIHTFKVNARRHNKEFPLSSMELNQQLGAFVLQNFSWKVNLKNPDLTIGVEIRGQDAYLYTQKVRGLGGYPVGVSGKVLLLISGGIDSPVAAYKMMKRGAVVDYLNFITPPHTDAASLSKVDELIKILIAYQGHARLYQFNYTKLMNLIGLSSKQSYKLVLMRRSFYRIAQNIAYQKKYLALANGDNLGQVASQTIEAMATIQAKITLPIYRPLLTADKLEIINLAQRIQTYELSIRPAVDTCEFFAPKAPVIKPTLIQAEKLETELLDLKKWEEINDSSELEIKKYFLNHLN